MTLWHRKMKSKTVAMSSKDIPLKINGPGGPTQPKGEATPQPSDSNLQGKNENKRRNRGKHKTPKESAPQEEANGTDTRAKNSSAKINKYPEGKERRHHCLNSIR